MLPTILAKINPDYTFIVCLLRMTASLEDDRLIGIATIHSVAAPGSCIE